MLFVARSLWTGDCRKDGHIAVAGKVGTRHTAHYLRYQTKLQLKVPGGTYHGYQAVQGTNRIDELKGWKS